MPYTYKPEPPKTRVYRFGTVWHWKCKSPRCQHGGRARVWEKAVERANEHVASHREA